MQRYVVLLMLYLTVKVGNLKMQTEVVPELLVLVPKKSIKKVVDPISVEFYGISRKRLRPNGLNVTSFLNLNQPKSDASILVSLYLNMFSLTLSI